MSYVLFFHNILRWLVLLFGLLAVIKAIGGLAAAKKYTGSDNKTGLLFMIFCDIQLLIGLVLYFGRDWFSMLKNSAGEVMKNSAARFFCNGTCIDDDYCMDTGAYGPQYDKACRYRCTKT